MVLTKPLSWFGLFFQPLGFGKQTLKKYISRAQENSFNQGFHPVIVFYSKALDRFRIWLLCYTPNNSWLYKGFFTGFGLI